MNKRRLKNCMVDNKDWLYQKYVLERLSWKDFYKKYNISFCLLQKRLKEFSIKRELIPWNKNKKTGLVPKSAFKLGQGGNKGSFKKQHKPWNKNLTKEIDKRLKKITEKISGKNHWNYKKGEWVKMFCIDCKKSISPKSKRCLKCQGKFNSGRNHWAWNPNTDLLSNIRLLDEYKEWRMLCLKRDYFKCCDCDSKKRLEVHHKKPMRQILQEFLREYDQFSPLEDKETLIRLARKWQPFWDMDNGETLCEKHHKALKRRSIALYYAGDGNYYC